MNVYGIILLAFVFQISPLLGTEPKGLKGKAEKILFRINAVCAEYDLPPWELDIANATEKLYRGNRITGDFPWLYNPGKFSFKFDPARGGCIAFINHGLDDKATLLNNKFIEFEEKPSRNWSPEVAVEVATKFALACNEHSLKSVGTPQVEFVQDLGTYDKETKRNKYRVPYWWVIFPRVDPHGHEFDMEYISVSILEKSGPYSFHSKIYSRYEPVEGEPLTLEDVMPAAIKYVRRLTKRGPVAGMFEEGKIDETPANTKLMIVKPNHMADLDRIPGTRDIDLNARLAWVIWFRWSADDPDAYRQQGGVSAWIDAHTGKPLGGEAF